MITITITSTGAPGAPSASHATSEIAIATSLGGRQPDRRVHADLDRDICGVAQ